MADLRTASASVSELLVFGFSGVSVSRHAERLIKLGAGGVILFSRNFSHPLQVAELCRDLKALAAPRKLLVMVDQEGGRVARLGPPFTNVPCARIIGQTGDRWLAEAAGCVLGRELAVVDIDLDFAPVVDVDTNPKNPVIAERSFGSTPKLVAEMAESFIRGIQKQGVAACVKHFPGHGDTLVDSHLALPLLPHSLERLEQVELPPFERSIKAGVASVMVAHLLVPALAEEEGLESHRSPVSMGGVAGSHGAAAQGVASIATRAPAALNGQPVNSEQVIGQPVNSDPVNGPPLKDLPASLNPRAVAYLRRKLQYQGLIVTDDLEMGAITKHWGVPEAAVLAVTAGVDMVLVCHTENVQVKTLEALQSAVRKGRLPLARLKDACMHVQMVKEKYCKTVKESAVDENKIMEVVGCKEHQNLVGEIEQAAATRMLF